MFTSLGDIIRYVYNCRSVDRLIRASRHYERAAQMLTRQTVATARGVCHNLDLL